MAPFLRTHGEIAGMHTHLLQMAFSKHGRIRFYKRQKAWPMMTAAHKQSDIPQSQKEKTETMEGGQHFPRTIKPCKRNTLAKSATLVPLMRMPAERILNKIAMLAKSTTAKSMWSINAASST